MKPSLFAFVSFLGRVGAVLLPPPVPQPNIATLSLDSFKGGETRFNQFIDHSDPYLGTFSQRYWWDTTYWEGPGSPVLVFSPGEASADYYSGFLTNQTLVGLYAQAIGGAIILLEHRYWGESSPFSHLSTSNLTYLTLNDSVADLAHFARRVQLPFDDSGQSNAPNAPWILIGGSYSGNLAAWLNHLSPGTFWAYHASSAPVQAIRHFWQYFTPIWEGMPRNCSTDFQKITAHIDNVLEYGSDEEVKSLKEGFGMGDIKEKGDFASAVGFALAEWQYISITSTYHRFYQMCDTIQGVRPIDLDGWGTDLWFPSGPPTSPPTSRGVGLEKALINYSAWFKHEFLPGACSNYGYEEWAQPNSTGCYDSYNETSPFYTDYLVSNTFNRQWFWMLCNEPFFYWQTGAPAGQPSIMSRHVTPEYFERQCRLMFPDQGDAKSGLSSGKMAEDVNRLTSGWFVNTTRLIWTNGEFDPWRSGSVSSKYRPGGPQQSTVETPVYLIPGGRHCNDLDARSGERNQGVQRVQLESIARMVGWVNEFYDVKGGKGRGNGATPTLTGAV
ncbi:serine carboxypeptidase S28-domain-containing protein [Apiosordaria backusii]|uniref:Serine carboxypeptidase S28-domain-containing protein n=1 Tax=Apiosordaria backusii TaxID=314023 RepID=A0AA40DMR8_9PEZI|nr:serine carboxypeptidase S28-domain-containing protein [Apiosordaria backusii]